MKIKHISLMIVTLLLSLILVGCNWQVEASNNYESSSDYEQARIDMISTLKESVVVVMQSDGNYGSGIIFNVTETNALTQTYSYAVLTAYENVSGQNVSTLTVQTPSNGTFVAKSMHTNSEYLFAVLYFETTAELSVYPIVQITSGLTVDLTAGEDVYAVGTPYEISMFNYVSEGLLGVTSYDYQNISGLAFVHSAETNPGMEGGPIVDLEGNVVGIQVGKIYMSDESVTAVPVEGINFAINLNVIGSMVAALDTNFTQTSASVKTLSLDVTSLEEHDMLATEMIASVSPSVVSVIGSEGLGSGTVFKVETVDELTSTYQYYVLTNNHVVDGNSELRIRMTDQTEEYAVSSYQVNVSYDIAVLRIVTTAELPVLDIPPITASEYVDLVEGQDVYAIGNPLTTSLHQYVTHGILSISSIKYKSITGLGLMHDAEINPGNSGGPLFNLNGEVIGVNVAKVTSLTEDGTTYYTEGINYSLNINIIAQVINNFTEEGYVTVNRSAKLGTTVVEYDNTFGYYPQIYNSGVMAIDFDYTRNGYLSLQAYDLILSADGNTVTDIASLAAVLATKNLGDSVVLGGVRLNEQGQVVTFEVTVVLS